MRKTETKTRLAAVKQNLITEMKVHTTNRTRINAMLNYVWEKALVDGDEYLNECEDANGAEWVATDSFRHTMSHADKNQLVTDMYNDTQAMNRRTMGY